MVEILNIFLFCPNFLDFRSVMFFFFFFGVVSYLVVWLELIHSLASKNPWLAFRYYEMEISKSSLGAQIYSSFVENGHINPRKFHIDNLQIGHIWKGWKKEPALEKKTQKSVLGIHVVRFLWEYMQSFVRDLEMFITIDYWWWWISRKCQWWIPQWRWHNESDFQRPLGNLTIWRHLWKHDYWSLTKYILVIWYRRKWAEDESANCATVGDCWDCSEILGNLLGNHDFACIKPHL